MTFIKHHNPNKKSVAFFQFKISQVMWKSLTFYIANISSEECLKIGSYLPKL